MLIAVSVKNLSIITFTAVFKTSVFFIYILLHMKRKKKIYTYTYVTAIFIVYLILEY
jgi:hypothetical protein